MPVSVPTCSLTHTGTLTLDFRLYMPTASACILSSFSSAFVPQGPNGHNLSMNMAQFVASVPKGPVPYKVVFHTSDITGAGTNASAFITLHGAQDSGRQHVVHNDGGRFDR